MNNLFDQSQYKPPLPKYGEEFGLEHPDPVLHNRILQQQLAIVKSQYTSLLLQHKQLESDYLNIIDQLTNISFL